MKFLLKTIVLTLLVGAGSLAYAESGSVEVVEKDQLESIEAERYEQIDGKWEVEAEFEDASDYDFYVYNIDDKEELVEEITDALNAKFDLGLDNEETEDLLEIDDEDELDEDEDEDDKDEDNDDNDDKNEQVISNTDKDELIRLLILALIAIILESEGGADLDLSSLLQNL